MKKLYGACRSRVQRGLLVFLAMLLVSAPALGATGRTVLVLGDSLSAGYGMEASQGWVALVDRRLKATYPGWRVVNASISGETTAGGASRAAAEIARTRPAVVVVELGANDGLRGLALEQTRANLDRIIRAAKGADAKVLLIGMRLPPNFGGPYTRGFERNYRELASRHEVALLPFLLAPIAGDRKSFQGDNLHPVAAVQPKLRDHVWTALEPLLGQRSVKRRQTGT